MLCANELQNEGDAVSAAPPSAVKQGSVNRSCKFMVTATVTWTVPLAENAYVPVASKAADSNAWEHSGCANGLPRTATRSPTVHVEVIVHVPTTLPPHGEPPHAPPPPPLPSPPLVFPPHAQSHDTESATSRTASAATLFRFIAPPYSMPAPTRGSPTYLSNAPMSGADPAGMAFPAKSLAYDMAAP